MYASHHSSQQQQKKERQAGAEDVSIQPRGRVSLHRRWASDSKERKTRRCKDENQEANETKRNQTKLKPHKKQKCGEGRFDPSRVPPPRARDEASRFFVRRAEPRGAGRGPRSRCRIRRPPRWKEGPGRALRGAPSLVSALRSERADFSRRYFSLSSPAPLQSSDGEARAS